MAMTSPKTRGTGAPHLTKMGSAKPIKSKQEKRRENLCYNMSRMERKGRERKGREGKGREGKGREGKGREGKGREGKGRRLVKEKGSPVSKL